jgi:hypothetical protein
VSNAKNMETNIKDTKRLKVTGRIFISRGYPCVGFGGYAPKN